MTDYKKLDNDTIQASTIIADSTEWGNATLRRIFNFKARQVITVYERGGLKDFMQPGTSSSSSKTGYAAAVTSAMQVQNFRDIEGTAEIAEMHRRLTEKGGTPPPLAEIFPDDMQKPSLKPRPLA